MRKLLPILVLLSVSCFGGTWALVQKPCNTACPASGTTCAVTVTSTGTGNILISTSIKDSASNTTTISSVSGGGTWTHPTGANGVDASAGSSDSAYNLSSTSGATSITLTMSAASATIWTACVREYSLTGATAAFDTTANRDQSTAATSFAGATLTLTGTNDLIVQYGTDTGACSAISGTGYGNFGQTGNTAPNGNCIGDALNVSVGTANTWTTGSGRAALGAIAIKESGAAAAPCQSRSLMGIGC
jgi:hypothetical protein